MKSSILFSFTLLLLSNAQILFAQDLSTNKKEGERGTKITTSLSRKVKRTYFGKPHPNEARSLILEAFERLDQKAESTCQFIHDPVRQNSYEFSESIEHLAPPYGMYTVKVSAVYECVGW